jgi:hypothetical protein
MTKKSYDLEEAAAILGEKKGTVWARIYRGAVTIDGQTQQGRRTRLTKADMKRLQQYQSLQKTLRSLRGCA